MFKNFTNRDGDAELSIYCCRNDSVRMSDISLYLTFFTI